MKFKTYDCANDEAPKMSSGSNPTDNPGIEPFETAIPDTPGEKAVNDVAAESMSKAQPYKCQGSGYTGC